jgi:SSS family solute:Na+ symporter
MFGVMAIAGHIAPLPGPNGEPDTNTVVPNLFQHMFPSGFTGLAFAMIVIGALVPAAFMSIASANLFTRNIYKEYLRPDASEREQAQVSKIVSLMVKVGAPLFIADQTAPADYFTDVVDTMAAEPAVTAGT